jgi:isoquinoline 1-oxidoreductase subunit alpha
MVQEDAYSKTVCSHLEDCPGLALILRYCRCFTLHKEWYSPHFVGGSLQCSGVSPAYCRTVGGRRRAMIQMVLDINGGDRAVVADPEMPLLWVLRDLLGLTGTKYGCGIGRCGACTVHVDGDAMRSCQIQVSNAVGKRLTTIEGIGKGGLSPVQSAWIAEQVPQCGYCQPGQIMSATALLLKKPNATDTDIDDAMAGNLCRCATYSRVRKAIHRAAEEMKR